MEDILKSKLIEVVTELRSALGNDKTSENEKNFLCGELAVIIDLMKKLENK